MATVDVECPECAESITVEESALGTPTKCPKCKFVFTAERGGGAYDLVVDPAPRATRREAPPSNDGAPRRPGGSAPKPAERPETEAERKLRERMERWAEKMEES